MTDNSYTHLLRNLMQQVGISSFRQLSRITGVSEKQLGLLRQGKVLQIRLEILLKLSEVLQVPLAKLIAMFQVGTIALEKEKDVDREIASLKEEYQRLKLQIEQQRENLHQEFQQSSLNVLESWLIYWPAAAAAVQANPNFPATRLLPLVKPVEKLLETWGVEKIAAIGEEIPFDPQWHQAIEGNPKTGDLVKVRNLGYRQGDKLLYRAKVSIY
jgi:molecular chaperone GrpE (heat shock protein)